MADNLADLTDLIAAALGDKIMHTNGSGDRNRAYAAHVALVVEQHTNGRITELEAVVVRVKELAARRRESSSTFYTSDHQTARDIDAALEGES